MNEEIINYDYDDEIEDDGKEFVVLPEDDYNFLVVSFERGEFPGSAKMPPCKKITLKLRIVYEDKQVDVYNDIILNNKFNWKISGFFRAIGDKERGKRVKMNWPGSVGKMGRAHIKQRKWTGKDGTEKISNEIDEFYDYKDEYFANSDVPSTGFSEVRESDDDLPF